MKEKRDEKIEKYYADINYTRTATAFIYPMSYLAIAIILCFMDVSAHLQTMMGTAINGAIMIGIGIIFHGKEKKNEK